MGTSVDVLRLAAVKIRAGWYQGDKAADADGRPVTLYVAGSSEHGRTTPNPAAVKLSAYGAIVMAQYELRASLGPTDWDLVFTWAKQATGAAHGGKNYVHPLIQFNESAGRTADEVAALLEDCANELDLGARVPPPIRLPDGEGMLMSDPTVEAP